MSRGNTKSILDLLKQRAAAKRAWISNAKHRLLVDPVEGNPATQAQQKTGMS